MAINSRTYSFDANLQLSDGGTTHSADGSSQVSGVDQVLDLGGRQSTSPAQQARIDAVCVIDLLEIDIASTNEVYDLILIGSNDSAFGSGTGEHLASIQFGKGASRDGSNMKDSTTGRYELMFTNEQNGTMYQFLKLYLDVGGTTPSIKFRAWVAVLPEP